jgi:DNA repair exonuclease SbcCD ATPase subunit
VSEFCKLNNIEDIDGFIKKCFITGLNVEKYGLLGKTLNEGENHLKISEIIEKEVIKEVIVEKEIPVEIIKEVEKIVEVIKEVIVEKEIPVEIIKEVEVIKEVPVEKIVTKVEYISDKTNENELIEKMSKLEGERQSFSNKLDEKTKEVQIFSTKTQEMENLFQKEITKKDKELDELRQTLDGLRRTSTDDNKSKMLQQTIQNLNSEIRELKKKNEELNKKMLDKPKQLGDIPARFHGSSNLNDDLYK